MKISKKDLRKLIDEEVRKILSTEKATPAKDKVKDENSPAPTIAPPKPKTKEPPKPRPLKVPEKWPGPMPKPQPKAENKGTDKKKKINESFSSLVENVRMKQLMQELPMEFNPENIPPHLMPGQETGLHPSIQAGIEGRSQTPFSAVELFNTKVLTQSMLEKLGSEEYDAIVQDVVATEELDMQQLFNTYQLIIKLERPKRRRLEQLALSIVKNKFGLPDDIVQKIQASLKNDGEIEPPDGGDEDPVEEVMDEFTPDEQAIIKKHLDKRIVHNALMMGAGYRAHDILEGMKASLDAIDDKLYPLYVKSMPNFEIFMWKFPVKASFGGRIMMGKAELDIQPNGDVKAKAEATMFPILLHEVAKAAVELLFAQHLIDIYEKHGLPVYNAVIKQSESYLDEHWMKLIGPRLWKYLHDAIDYVVRARNNDYTIVAYILNKMAVMEPEDFMALMSDVLNRGDVAITKIQNIINTVEDDIEAYENQNNVTPDPADIAQGENHEDEISRLLKTNQEDLLKTKAPEPPPTRKKLVDMEVDELNTELGKAIDSESYKTAAKIRDLIKAKTGNK